MLSKDLVHPFYRVDQRSSMVAEAFQKQLSKMKCIVLLILSFKTCRFYRSTLTPKMEELTFLFSTRNGVLRCFNVEACPKLRSIQLDSQPGADIESGTFSKITSFSISVPNPLFIRSRSKVAIFLLFEMISS